jgi:hypothetical protein
MNSIRSNAAIAFSLSATTLVFFNYLYFLKWYQFSGSRLWVVAIMLASAAFIVPTFHHYRRFWVPAALLLSYCGYTVVGYFYFQRSNFDLRYLGQFLSATVPFFAAGILAGQRPNGTIAVAVLAAVTLLLALPIAWLNYGSLWDGDDFRNILAIPQISGRTPYYSYYQLVAYGIALGSVPVFVWLLLRVRLVAFAVGLVITLLLAELGSRTIFLLLPLVFSAMVFRIKGLAQSAVFFGLATALVIGVFTLPAGKHLAVVQRMDGETERYEQGAIFKPKSEGYSPYDTSGAFSIGDGADHRTWSRRTLFEFAARGWLSDIYSFVIGHGLGSYSLNLTGIYPGWLPAPHEGEIYPHNWILEAGYEGGAIAVVLLGTFLILPFWRNLTKKTTAAEALSITGMYMLVFGAAFLSGGIALNYTLFFLYGAALASQAPAEMRSGTADNEKDGWRGTAAQ